MHRKAALLCAALTTVALVAGFTTDGLAQVGKGIIDPNVAAEKDLLALPHMTSAIAKGIVAKRPFLKVTDLNTFLLGQSLTSKQLSEFYKKAFIHVNLNTGTADEILLIPGAGKRMAHEFEEYRPWKSFKQFDKEISKYVGPAETARLAQYVFIPINLNAATDEEILGVPGVGRKMLHEFKEYRPWKTVQQFRKEIGKYVDAKEVARLERYVAIP